jgi:hypothetical protein
MPLVGPLPSFDDEKVDYYLSSDDAGWLKIVVSLNFIVKGTYAMPVKIK